MSKVRGTLLGGLDALPYGAGTGAATYLVTRASETGLQPLLLALLLGVVVFVLLATVSTSRYVADGTAFPITRFVLSDAILFWP